MPSIADFWEGWLGPPPPAHEPQRAQLPSHWFAGDHWPLGLLSVRDDTEWLVGYQTGHAIHEQRQRDNRAPQRRSPLD